MTADTNQLRQDIIDTCLQMNAMGINQGTSGNVSARITDGMLITPTAVPYEHMKPEQIGCVNRAGQWESDFLPSTEWRFHLAILNEHPEVNAVVHTHSLYASILAIRREDIPAIHYMIAAAGGPTIKCATYATYGTQELADAALIALTDRNCCLLANHGMIAVGPNLAKALWLAKEVEVLAQQCVISRLLGGSGPCLLSAAEIQHVQDKIKDYGRKS